MQGAAHIIPLLIKAGCRANDPDSRGFTAVEVALLQHDCDTAYALYCAGALFTKRQLLLLSILLRHSSLLRCVFVYFLLKLAKCFRRRTCSNLHGNAFHSILGPCSGGKGIFLQSFPIVHSCAFEIWASTSILLTPKRASEVHS